MDVTVLFSGIMIGAGIGLSFARAILRNVTRNSFIESLMYNFDLLCKRQAKISF
jgi:uncharacterized membrane protein AbrB (regulator of aidB expression)